jgi:hypothetical protein
MALASQLLATDRHRRALAVLGASLACGWSLPWLDLGDVWQWVCD